MLLTLVWTLVLLTLVWTLIHLHLTEQIVLPCVPLVEPLPQVVRRPVLHHVQQDVVLPCQLTWVPLNKPHVLTHTENRHTDHQCCT